jgi:hypothetical protein
MKSSRNMAVSIVVVYPVHYVLIHKDYEISTCRTSESFVPTLSWSPEHSFTSKTRRRRNSDFYRTTGPLMQANYSAQDAG